MAELTIGFGGPGTGALGGPPVQHNYKRAVQRAAPRDFAVDVLPPTKFGSGFCYGMRIWPIIHGGECQDDTSSRSSGSANSRTEYEVWRRWEDCLYFQEILEEEYGLMARNKRQRLAAGKGVKKNGMYIHSDQAASFESLPPGPEANSVAKDIHEIIPRLTRKGTIFRPSQATVDQRGKEFQAMIETLFSDDVPTLIKELRETRLVRDFFAYWRRDKDHDRKAHSSSAGTRDSVASSAFSMYFSASNVSLQTPSSYADLPPSPALPSGLYNASPRSSSKLAKGKSPAYARSDSSASSSSLSPPSVPAAQPAPMSFSVSARGSLYVDVAGSADEHWRQPDDQPQTAPPRMQSTSRPQSVSTAFTYDEDAVEVPILFAPEDHSWSLGPDHGRGLQSLPEDQELESVMSRLSMATTTKDVPPPVRRSRNNSCPDRTNRNCVVFTTTPLETPEAAGREHTQATHPDCDSQNGAGSQNDRGVVERSHPPSVVASSSRNSTASLSSFSLESSRSSWRTSVASERSVASDMTSSPPQDSCFDPERSSVISSFSMQSSLSSITDRWSPYTHPQPSHVPRASVATMNSLISNSSVDAVLPRRMSPPPPNGSARRSFSADSRHSADAESNDHAIDDLWNEQQDEFIDAYFYDPSLRSRHTSPVPPDDQHYGGREVHPLRNKHMSTPDRFPKPFQDRPPGQFHLPWSPPASPPRISSPTGADAYTIKAILRESIVLLRAHYGTSLPEIRERIREKFANQEELPLSNSFVIGYLLPRAAQQTASGRSRSYSLSSGDSSPALRYVYSEEEWHTAVAGCSGKLTIRILDSRS